TTGRGYRLGWASAPAIATTAASTPAAIASVAYTMPASASHEVTLERTSVTLLSSLTGCRSTRAAAARSRVAFPHGTPSAHTTRREIGRATCREREETVSGAWLH